MTNTTKYSDLKLKDLKALAADKGIQPTGDRRCREVWLQALFDYEIAEAEPYIPTLEEEREHLERCYGSYEVLEESFEWLSQQDIFGKTHKQKLDRLVEILLNYEKQPNNQRYLSDYISIVSQLSFSLFIAKGYRDTFSCDYHPILLKKLDDLLGERLEFEAECEERRKEQTETRNYQRQTYSSFFAPTLPLSDYLAVLELPANASRDEVKRAYRKLSKQYHPDMPTGDSDRFIKLQSAYEKVMEMMDVREEAVPS